jgi:hypothetical protein
MVLIKWTQLVPFANSPKFVSRSSLFSIKFTDVDVALCLVSRRLDANRFQTCMTNTSAVLKQKFKQEDVTRRDLQPRTEEMQPLKPPTGTSATAYSDWFKSIVEQADENAGYLTLTPSEAQKETWKVNHNGEDIPIGATGVWRPFGNKKMDYEMHGLRGCTAIIAIVSIIKTSKRDTSADRHLVIQGTICRSLVGRIINSGWSERFLEN